MLRRKQRKAAKQNKRRPADRPCFNPQDQLIFSYHNGERVVEADPIAIHCALLAEPDFLADVKMSGLQSEAASTAASAAYKRVVNACRKVFKIAEFKSEEKNGKFVRSGMTDANVKHVLSQFVSFIEDLKKKAGLWPTSAMPSQEHLDAPSAMPSSAGSTSSATEPSPGEPSQSPSGSELPSEEKPLESFGTL